MADAIVGTGAYGRWQIIVTLSSQNAAANTSYVRVRGIIYNDGGYTSYNNGSVAKSISGTSAWSGSGPFSVAAYSSITFIDVYFTVTHGADGNKTVSYTANLGATGTTNIGGPTSVAVGMVLPRIPQLPSAPAQPSVSPIGTTTATVGWVAPANNGATITTYGIEVALNSGFSPLLINTTSTSLSKALSGLTDGTLHYVRVRAYNSARLG